MKYMCIINLPEYNLTKDKIYEGTHAHCNMIKIIDDVGLERFVHSCLFKYIEGNDGV